MSGEGRFVTSADGIKIWAQNAGDPSKPAVVFIHGFSCSSLHFEKQFTDAQMLTNLHMIRYDVRGHGQSDQPIFPEAYESAHHAEDLNAVCEAFKVNKPFLAGWSLGGIVAADAVAHYGTDYISGSILINAMPYRAMHPEVANPVILEILPRILANDATEFSKGVRDFVISCATPGRSIPYSDMCMWTGTILLQHPLARTYSVSRTQDERALMSVSKTLPLLCIHGSEDQHMIATDHEQFMKLNFGNVEYHTIPGIGHMTFWERPEKINELMLAWIKKVSQ